MRQQAIKRRYIAELDELETALWDGLMIEISRACESGDPEEMAGFVLAIRAKFAGKSNAEPIIDLEDLYNYAEREVIACGNNTLVDDDLDDFISWIS